MKLDLIGKPDALEMVLEDIAPLQGNLLLRGVAVFQHLSRLPDVDDKTAETYLGIEEERVAVQSIAFFKRQGMQSPEDIGAALAQMRTLFADLPERVQALKELKAQGISSVPDWMKENWGFAANFNWEKDSAESLSTARVSVAKEHHALFKARLAQALSTRSDIAAVLHAPKEQGTFMDLQYEVYHVHNPKTSVYPDLAHARAQAKAFAGV